MPGATPADRFPASRRWSPPTNGFRRLSPPPPGYEMSRQIANFASRHAPTRPLVTGCFCGRTSAAASSAQLVCHTGCPLIPTASRGFSEVSGPPPPRHRLNPRAHHSRSATTTLKPAVDFAISAWMPSSCWGSVWRSTAAGRSPSSAPCCGGYTAPLLHPCVADPVFPVQPLTSFAL